MFQMDGSSGEDLIDILCYCAILFIFVSFGNNYDLAFASTEIFLHNCKHLASTDTSFFLSVQASDMQYACSCKGALLIDWPNQALNYKKFIYVDKIQSCPIGIPITDLSKFRIVCYIISFLVYRNSTLGYLVVVFSTPFRGQFSYLVRIILCCKNQKPK